MAKVLNLDAYRKVGIPGKPPPAPPGRQEDVIVIKRRPDGTYTARITGAYAASPLLAIEHASDLAANLARKEWLR